MSGHVWTEAVPIGDLLIRAASRHPDRDAVVFLDDRYTYAQVLDSGHGGRARAIEPGGKNLGARRHLLHNGIAFIEAFFGVAMAGAVVAPINAWYKVNELRDIASNAELVAILTTDNSNADVDFPDVLVQAFPELTSSNGLRLDFDSAPGCVM